ncbi:FHA domain-containing protein [Iamia sp. SCSIO 61187]|uniref:FHA domain-containing protein n=1 Tax=Iamia sp. SCSIO 61187 TaxID=2722752 RepID=UPI001C62B3AA|nr:FHA domain-containing protein [Iamia sp. SCSIO 61187]QYG92465.1 FHA domain-containing protein [Iamia sp. SCSIO 61187]
MLDLLVLVAGFAVGALAIVGINGARRGSRPVPVVGAPAARSHPGPQPRPPAPGPSSPAAHGIRVSQPAARPAPPRAAPPPAAGATAVAAGPSLGKRPSRGAGRPRLELEDGSDGVDLVDQTITLGRGADQRLRIKDTRASRAHAVVRRRSKGREGWEVEDQGSANGTELNGHRIPDGRVAPLRDGDRIGIGGTVVVYSEGGGAPPPPGSSSDPEATRIAP